LRGHDAPKPLRSGAERASSLAFVHDRFDAGTRFRILNVIDNVTGECVEAVLDHGQQRVPDD
jgi:hypothetical protein